MVRALRAQSNVTVDLSELAFADSSVMLDLVVLARRLRARAVSHCDDPEELPSTGYEDLRSFRMPSGEIRRDSNIVGPHQRLIAHQDEIALKCRIDAEARGVSKALGLSDRAPERPGVRDNRLAEWML